MANKKVFYFPFVHVNEYVEISKESISESGFEVLDFKKLFNIKTYLIREIMLPYSIGIKIDCIKKDTVSSERSLSILLFFVN
jgi:hypothetical protein